MTDAKPPCKCLAKSTSREPSKPRRAFNWVRARRGQAQFYEDRVEHGDRIVRYSDVTAATRYTVRSLIGINSAKILVLETANTVETFGLMRRCKCLEGLPLNVVDGGDYKMPVTRGALVFRGAMALLAVAWIWWAFFRDGAG